MFALFMGCNHDILTCREDTDRFDVKGLDKHGFPKSRGEKWLITRSHDNLYQLGEIFRQIQSVVVERNSLQFSRFVSTLLESSL